MLETRRIFSTLNIQTCKIQWYIHAREGRLGPYSSKYQALIKLKSYIEYCQKHGQSGGRQLGSASLKDDTSHLVKVAHRRV